jgi:hypothetical protein
MEQQEIAEKAQFIALVATEAADESDAIERHPEIVDVLTDLSHYAEVPGLFGANGHDPVAFLKALAEGLAPYRTRPLEEAPELVNGLALVAQTLRHGVSNGGGPASH